MSKNLTNCMTVADLIEELKQMDPTLPVMFAYNYGDRHGTTVCAPVEYCDEGAVRYSEYHQLHELVDDEENEDMEDAPPRANTENVIVIQ